MTGNPIQEPSSTSFDVAVGTNDTKGKVFRGWKIAVSGGLMLTLQTALILQSFGHYAVVLREQFGFSKTTVSIAYSSNRAESGLLGPIHGWALKRFGTRRVMRFGALVMLGGFWWFSRVNSPVQYVISSFVIAIGGGFAGFLTIATEIVKWFERRRTRALSVGTLGLALGGLFGPLVVLSLLHFGWRETALVSGLILSGVTLGFSGLFGGSPLESGERIDGIEPQSETGAAPESDSWHMTAAEAMRTSAFWLISFGHASALLVVGPIIAHLSLYLTEEKGYSLQGASYVAAALPIAQIMGMIIGGHLGDRASVSKRWLCSAAMAGHVIGLALLAFAVGPTMIWAFVFFHGIAWGARGPLMPAIRADYFGSTAYGQIMGYSSMILMLGAVGGPLLAGVLADVTDSYRIGFTILAVLSASGCILFALAKPPPRTPRTRATQ